MTSGIDAEANFAAIDSAMAEAQTGGADVLFTPEMSLLLDRDRPRASQTINSEAYAGFQRRLAELATRGQTDLALGSMPLALPDGKWVNRSHYFFANGREPVTYDKIHMFDVELATGESWRESAAYEPGRSVVTESSTPLGRLGLTICYDLRFPALFEALGRAKCDAIAVPAAFTRPTGEAHWHAMLRARAIEASAFVIAAAQVGTHEDGRQTFGHSLVVDPWGEVLLDMGGDEPGLAFCDVDLGRIEDVRRQLPSLANRREIPN
ncbi:carbon-nitrogen hydrolase family protein [Erythrobacter rubeus]